MSRRLLAAPDPEYECREFMLCDVKGDGNCLFRALYHSLKDQYRRALCHIDDADVAVYQEDEFVKKCRHRLVEEARHNPVFCPDKYIEFVESNGGASDAPVLAFIQDDWSREQKRSTFLERLGSPGGPEQSAMYTDEYEVAILKNILSKNCGIGLIVVNLETGGGSTHRPTPDARNKFVTGVRWAAKACRDNDGLRRAIILPRVGNNHFLFLRGSSRHEQDNRHRRAFAEPTASVMSTDELATLAVPNDV